MEWRHSASPCPKKFRVQKSTGRVLTSIFWDQDIILLIDYLPKGQTINTEYHSSLLVQLKDILKEKHHGKFSKGVLFLHDSALVHQTLATQKKLANLGFQCLESRTQFSGSGPVRLLPVPWTEKTIGRSPFFIRRGGHCCCRDLVGWTTFWIFFEWLSKVTAIG